jgi:hypothetical protein
MRHIQPEGDGQWSLLWWNGAEQTVATYIVAVERYKIRSISCHARNAPTNAPSRIYGLQMKKELT